MQSITDRLLEIFGPERIIEHVVALIPDLAVATLSFIAFYILWRIARRAIEPLLLRAGIDKTARTFIQTALQYSILAIGVNENIANVREILLATAASDPDFLDDPAAQVVVKSLNDYNTEVELRVWLRDEHKHVAERFQLRERMYEALNAAGVEMPFETIKLEPVKIINDQEA